MIRDYESTLEHGFLGCLLTLLILGLILLATLLNYPEELENGCISYNDSIYCEEVSK